MTCYSGSSGQACTVQVIHQADRKSNYFLLNIWFILLSCFIIQSGKVVSECCNIEEQLWLLGWNIEKSLDIILNLYYSIEIKRIIMSPNKKEAISHGTFKYIHMNSRELLTTGGVEKIMKGGNHQISEFYLRWFNQLQKTKKWLLPVWGKPSLSRGEV